MQTFDLANITAAVAHHRTLPDYLTSFDTSAPHVADDAILAALDGAARDLGYTLIYDAPPEGGHCDGCKGLTHQKGVVGGPTAVTIWVRPTLAVADRWRTLAHEMAHAMRGLEHGDPVLALAEILRDTASVDVTNPAVRAFMREFLSRKDTAAATEAYMKIREETTVELVVALLCDTIGADLRVSARYLAGYAPDPGDLAAALPAASGIANRLLAIIMSDQPLAVAA